MQEPNNVVSRWTLLRCEGVQGLRKIGWWVTLTLYTRAGYIAIRHAGCHLGSFVGIQRDPAAEHRINSGLPRNAMAIGPLRRDCETSQLDHHDVPSVVMRADKNGTGPVWTGVAKNARPPEASTKTRAQERIPLETDSHFTTRPVPIGPAHTVAEWRNRILDVRSHRNSPRICHKSLHW